MEVFTVGERIREGNDLYMEMQESGIIKALPLMAEIKTVGITTTSRTLLEYNSCS